MIEVATNLWVGSERDYLTVKLADRWCFVQACKIPYHRDALGYKGLGAPKNHPEYLYAYRDNNKLILNMIDADSPDFIPFDLFDASIQFIEFNLSANRKVLVHCNQGRSRGPGIALAYLRSKRFVPEDFYDAIKYFTKRYPDFQPANGVLGALEKHWGNFNSAPSLKGMKDAQRHVTVDTGKTS